MRDRLRNWFRGWWERNICVEGWEDEAGFHVGKKPPITHGRNCPCTPCQEEDWDTIEVNLRRYWSGTN